jgi:hypothetical protein
MATRRYDIEQSMADVIAFLYFCDGVEFVPAA